ncbi:hypothetical protein ACWGA0_21235 [Streptomyces erythrochromogenes]
MRDNDQFDTFAGDADGVPQAAEPTGRGAQPAAELVAGGHKSTETSGLALLINTILGGLGTLYATTRSTEITLTAALLVLLITVVVLAVRRGATPGKGPGGEDGRGGR